MKIKTKKSINDKVAEKWRKSGRKVAEWGGCFVESDVLVFTVAVSFK